MELRQVVTESHIALRNNCYDKSYCYLFNVGFLVAISAAITTPLDVAKTRIMLSSTSAEKEEVKISTMLKEVYRNHGAKG